MNETLIDRRRDMLAADHKWIEVARITTIGTTTISLPPCSQLGFFIVGGGGSGHGDFNTAGNPGNGGNGGCVNSFIVPFTLNLCSITVGSGGAQASSRKSSNNGHSSSVTYNNITYTSEGGYGGNNSQDQLNTKLNNSGYGGKGLYTYLFRNEPYKTQIMNFTTTHTAKETTIINNKTVYGMNGENGFLNVFDESDLNLYGAGGAGAYNTMDFTVPVLAHGGTTGGGAGGYGSNSSSQNKGQAGTFYGAGGGGGSFSSSHGYSQGGAGYQGIVIIYGK